ncbi:MAG: polysaccharide deacetylase [Hoeflea sp.]|uniref:polysaccharide deacetylase family protein n=1 Tax=Hoeflea sp. TaxID=1940281 RepID=UPI000C0E0073|nr:polysaccharide deacetylase family protein [Hoeflea sp.]PHR25702.1 MAG: polysaccharide deacetylase [Hoeflea sp.]
MLSRLALVCVLSGLAMAGCASKPPSNLEATKTAYVPVADKKSILGRDRGSEAENPAFDRFGKAPGSKRDGSLAGRTLVVSSLSDIRLRDKEVILTFDDGPMPGKTDRVLNILSQYGVKATFLMVGQMAKSYPAVAARVVSHGHSIGGHTYNHANLAKAGNSRALDDIATGNAAVTRATGTPVGFFRFPYLADTGALRNSVAARGMVILDVDIDTKDYFKSSPATIAARTMAQVRARRKGIILMHDIHHRTAAMLPSLLSQLKAGGYKVVDLKYRGSRVPQALVSAETGQTRTHHM